MPLAASFTEKVSNKMTKRPKPKPYRAPRAQGARPRRAGEKKIRMFDAKPESNSRPETDNDKRIEQGTRAIQKLLAEIGDLAKRELRTALSNDEFALVTAGLVSGDLQIRVDAVWPMSTVVVTLERTDGSKEANEICRYEVPQMRDGRENARLN